MKYLLLFAVSLLVLVSCQKEEENPPRVVFELGKCFNGTVPGNFTMEHDDSNFDDSLYCGNIFSNTHFPLSDEACEWLSNYCCEDNKEFSYINEMGEKASLFVDERKPVLMRVPTDTLCENQPDKKMTYYHYFEMADVWLQFSLSDKILSLEIWPDYEDILSENPKLGAHMRVNQISSSAFTIDTIQNNGGGRRGGNLGGGEFIQLIIPIDQSNISRPFPYEYQYLPEIEILGKTFFEVYTHEEDLKGFYTKIYYNKEYGIVSFVDETGVQWRVDM